eukprot:1907654-Amphidinium_carterae.1
MALGRWSSEAIDRYLTDTPNATVTSVARDEFSAGSRMGACDSRLMTVEDLAAAVAARVGAALDK